MSQLDSTAPERRGQTAAGIWCQPDAWAARLHARTVDRIKDPSARLTLQNCQLAWVEVGGWPTWELATRPGLPLGWEQKCSYLQELQRVLMEAAGALLVVTPPADPPDPDDGLQELWRRACACVELPSSRMLLEGQCTLLSVDGTTALVMVNATWLAMVQSRRTVVEAALARVLGQPVAVSFQEVQA